MGFGSVGPAGASALAASPHLTRLKDLSLPGSTAGDDGAEAIAASPHLAALEHILLNHSGIGDRGAVGPGPIWEVGLAAPVVPRRW